MNRDPGRTNQFVVLLGGKRTCRVTATQKWRALLTHSHNPKISNSSRARSRSAACHHSPLANSSVSSSIPSTATRRFSSVSSSAMPPMPWTRSGLRA